MVQRPDLDRRDFQIVKWWREHESVEKVAELAGLSRGGIYRILDKYGLSRPRGSGRRTGPAKRQYEKLHPNAGGVSWDRPLTVLCEKGNDQLLDALLGDETLFENKRRQAEAEAEA